jgi:anoctamin-8
VLLQQLAALLITRQVVGNFKEALLPYILDKLKLLKICVQAAEAMSPDTLQHQMSQFMDGNGGLEKKSDIDGVSEDAQQDDCSKFTRTETKHVCGEEIEIVRSGLTLSQAEVEAAMKRVSFHFSFVSAGIYV